MAAKMAPLLGGSAPSDTSISAWISGRESVSAEKFLAAAKASGVSIDEFLYDQTFRGRLDKVEHDVEALNQFVGGLHLLIENRPIGPPDRS